MRSRIKRQGDCPRFTDGAKRSRRIGTVPPIKPRIGITVDMDKEHLNLKKEYVHAVLVAGGLPFILAPVSPLPLPFIPSPLPLTDILPVKGLMGEGQGEGAERDRVRGDIASIADAIDGLLLTGGDDIPPEYYGEALSVPSDILKSVEKERLDFELSLFKEITKREKPIFAICYGMQMVNVALGGTLYQDIGIQVKPVPVGSKQGGALNHREGRHKIRIIKPLAFSLKPSDCSVNSSHHQAVKTLAHGLEPFALSEDGIVEGFYKPDYPFLVCVQWHPERDTGSDGISQSLFRSFVEAAKR